MTRISFDNVSVSYQSHLYRKMSLKDAAITAVTRRHRSSPSKPFVALRNVSFRIDDGEQVGIIGHNGAGKTTLLKVIAGLYPTSEGTRSVNGSIRSLFDLSLGFESEATGRENILYRGLLLGQSPRTMRDMEPEIVAFADIGDFIDMPVKTYSAGMLVRLAFAVSTTLRGDILLLDEVIGAGDVAFLDRARTRIQSMLESSRIVILATHDLNALRLLCRRVMVLDHGSLVFDGETDAAIETYLRIVGLT